MPNARIGQTAPGERIEPIGRTGRTGQTGQTGLIAPAVRSGRRPQNGLPPPMRLIGRLRPIGYKKIERRGGGIIYSAARWSPPARVCAP